MAMQTKPRQRKPRRRGFTLMEVLLVLVILVILGSMVGVFIQGARKRALEDAAKTQMGMLKSALQQYNTDIGSFPTSEQGLMALIAAPGDLRNPAKWRGPYLENEIPMDPWDHDYFYESSGTEFMIMSGGSNGVVENGGGDDISMQGR
jgi:general secretion pathway protein G